MQIPVQKHEEMSISEETKKNIYCLANKAQQPLLIIYGKECRPHRRVLNIGSHYYYNDNIPHFDWDHSNYFLKSFSKFFTVFNKCL